MSAGVPGQPTNQPTVTLLGGEVAAPHQFIRVADAMLDLDRSDDALAWATRGIESANGWPVAKLYDNRSRSARGARRRICRARPPTRTTPADAERNDLHAAPAGRSIDRPWELELAGARTGLAARDLGGLVDALLVDGDIDAAWDAAMSADAAGLGATGGPALAKPASRVIRLLR